MVLIDPYYAKKINGEIFDRECPLLPDHPGWFKASANPTANCSVTVLLRLRASAAFRGGAINGQQRADWRRHHSLQRRLEIEPELTVSPPSDHGPLA
ncbi:hypothetical protein HZZ13_23390 [Bradyrhizobium sp. CNPSo 4010]|uniref:Uncharacterized protein n=1 Tax=Bradyrhizobium agreste TaxID=2751811 RepID=A0ABS0PU31_9BRAD|nr:hypothetical protein [Bradyrhizobium agreste]MBH5400708.1 hypothetical protein [Bradyrhizobium agreste]